MQKGAEGKQHLHAGARERRTNAETRIGRENPRHVQEGVLQEGRVAEVLQRHEGPLLKSLDLAENLQP